MRFESVIGLEIHVQLATASKIFSGAATAYGAAANTQACPVDLGLPGVLPVLNREAIRMALTFGLAIEGEIAPTCRFDRKNYFYPDLPKGYQISQFEQPIVGRGTVTMDPADGDGEPRTIGITRAHLEEDAGKSVHDAFAGLTGIDLNRAGTPLLEVVSDPDLRTPEEAAAFFREMHALVRALRICDGNLNEGSMRCDANVSVRAVGTSELGERTEIKNLNSFRFVERALRHEIERQIDVLESGGAVRRETRLYDAERDETRPMRGKELSDDYRYFPDPDLLPVRITDEMLEEARAHLTELPWAKRARYVDGLGLSEYAARALANDPDTAAYFDATVEAGADARQAANWVMDHVAATLHRHETDIAQCPVSPTRLAQLIARIEDGAISNTAAKTVFDALWDQDGDIDGLIDAKGLRQMRDADELARIVAQVVDEYPEQVRDLKAGQTKILGFLVGQVMRATRGKADPRQVNALLMETIGVG